MTTLLSKSTVAAAAMFMGLSSTAGAVDIRKAAGGFGTDEIFVAESLWRDVTITSPAGIETIGAGLFKLEKSFDGVLFTALQTFCVEVDQFIDLPSTYAVQTLAAAFGVDPAAADKAAAISRLWALRFLDASTDSSPEFDGVAGANSKDRAAAFQVAIWEIELDGTGGALGTGGFQLDTSNPADAPLVGLVNQYLALANGATPLANIWALTSDASQDLLIPGSPNGGGPTGADDPVPAPAPLLLLGAAFAGFAALRRRRA